MSKVRSLVWQFFTEAENTDGTANCDTCEEVVKLPLGNTSNLAGHLKRRHPAEHQQRNSLKPAKAEKVIFLIQNL